jgi:hypothetical protein
MWEFVRPLTSRVPEEEVERFGEGEYGRVAREDH